MAAASSTSAVAWHLISQTGPALAHHAGCIICNTIYIHGGINKKMSASPLSSLYALSLDASGAIWREVTTAGSPALSHHACVALHDRYMVLIGGWNGKVRTTEIFAYDTQDDRWINPSSSGFAVGGGLSSHTATVLDAGTILIIGREGSTRIQKRYGNAYTLTGDIKKEQFVYHENPMGLASRSGHTMHVLGRNLYIIGGRADRQIEFHSGFSAQPTPCDMLAQLASKTKLATSMPKPPCGRKHHISAAGHGMILVHGGETFDGRSRDPVGEMFLILTKPHLQWIKLGDTRVRRAGHICCGNGDKIIIHGGLGEKGVIHSSTYELQIQ